MLVDDLPNEWKMEDGYRIQDQRSEWIPGGSGVTAKGGLGTVITHLTDENTEGELGPFVPSSHGWTEFWEGCLLFSCFCQTKVWEWQGGALHTQGLFQSEPAGSGSRGSCLK